MSLRRIIYLAGFTCVVALSAMLPVIATGQDPQTTDPEALLLKARESFQTGRYEQARKRFQRVLDLDPNNRAAFKGLVQSDQESERTASTEPSQTEGTPQDPAVARIHKKLQRIIVPQLTFDHIRLADAVEVLRRESLRLDTDSTDRGVSLSVLSASQNSAVVSNWSDKPVTFHLEKVTLLDAMRQLAQQAGIKVKIDAKGAQLVGCLIDAQPLSRGEFCVPPAFFGQITSTNEARKAALEAAGVQFPPGAGVDYFPDSQKLVVKNAQAELDLIEALSKEFLLPGTTTSVPPNP